MKSFCKLTPVFLKVQLDNLVEYEPPAHFHLTAQRSWAHFTDVQMKAGEVKRSSYWMAEPEIQL